jgi:hypothetical protein
MNINYTIKNGADVLKVIYKALKFYAYRIAALYAILRESGLSTAQITQKLKKYGVVISPRAISIAIEDNLPLFLRGFFSAKKGKIIL